jgi:hypothetical protein
MAELEIDSERATSAFTRADAAPPLAPAGEERRPAPPRAAWIRLVWPVAIGALGAIAFFAASIGLRHIRVPIGLDSYFYVQALRITSKDGLVNGHLLARPAYPLIGSVLADALRATPWTATVTLTMAMTGCLGMAGGAILARWRVRGWGLALGVFLIGASVTSARLLAGKSENLMNVWLLTAVLACAVWGGRRRATVAVALLAFGAGLAEWPFLAVFLLIVFISLVLWDVLPWSPAVSRRRAARAGAAADGGGRLRGHSSPDHLDPWMLLAATLAGAVLVFLVVAVWNGTGPSDAVELTQQPSQQYLIGLKKQLSFEWPLLTVPLFLVGWWAGRRFRNRDVEPVRWVLTVWAALAALTVLIGLTGVPLPAYRALTFDLPIGLGVVGAVFLPLAAARAARGWRRLGLRAAALLLVVLAAIPAYSMWFRDIHPPTNTAQLGEIQAASDYSLGLGGRTVILVVERTNPIITYFLQRAVVATTGGNGGQRVLMVVGHAGDVLEGQPTLWGWAPYDALSRALFRPVLKAYRQGAPILAGSTLDPPGFASAVSRRRPMVGSTLAVLRGPPPRPKTYASPTYTPLPRWWVQATLAIAMVALLWLCGVGWSGLAVPNAPAAVRAAIAPAFGAISLTATALITARMVHHLEGPAGLAALAVALAASGAVAAVSRHGLRARTSPTDG